VPTLRSQERRLRVVFQRAILVALAGIGCGTKAADAVATMDPDGGPTPNEGGVPLDGGREGGVVDRCATTLFTPSPPDTCGLYYKYPCGLPDGLTLRGACYFAVNDCAQLCFDIHYNCHAVDGYCTEAGVDGGDGGDEGGAVIPDSTGAVVIDCSICAGSAGRVPEGLIAATITAPSLLGAYFASAARLEAASVTAFQRLHAELAFHGAPGELQAAARAAERDEVRHTRAMARLARKHGARYVRPHVEAVAMRSLEEVARENAVEGCARETFGALLATWQAAHVDDASLAATLAIIAEDETRHAALSWSIHAWAVGELDHDARARLQAAWTSAIAALAEHDDEMLGLRALAFPTPAERAALANELAPLWTTLLAA
jgi:hypothetical protein